MPHNADIIGTLVKNRENRLAVVISGSPALFTVKFLDSGAEVRSIPNLFEFVNAVEGDQVKILDGKKVTDS